MKKNPVETKFCNKNLVKGIKQQGCPCKMDKGGTGINRLKNKQIDDCAQEIT